MKKYQLFMMISLAALIFSACSKNKKEITQEDSFELSLDKTSAKVSSAPQSWHITNKRICVVFGYDFNSPEVYQKLKALLEEKYGLDENGGLIYPLLYPDDFKHGSRGYSGDLFAILNDDTIDFSGLIILGAPEKTHTALARLQDKWEQQVPYPIIALYPQDDVLGLEAACDVVMDQGQIEHDNNSELAEQEILNADEILIDTINYIIALGSPMSRDISVQTHVQQMYKNKSFRRYVDSQSGLQSINHFVFN